MNFNLTNTKQLGNAMSGRRRGKKKKKGSKGYWANKKKKRNKKGMSRDAKKKIFFGVVIALIILIIAVPVTILRIMDDDGSGITSEGPDNYECVPIDPDTPIPDVADPTGDSPPFYNAGTGSSDWWISYPSQHPASGTGVNHPDCSKNPLKSKPVVIFAHSEGCAPCVQQGDDLDTVLNEIGREKVTFLDMLSGEDSCVNTVFGSYDPNGTPSYIPLTVIVTLIKDNSGIVQMAWHSNEGATGDDWLRAYIKDAIYYHDLNSSEGR
jgi:hypothetical protein